MGSFIDSPMHHLPPGVSPSSVGGGNLDFLVSWPTGMLALEMQRLLSVSELDTLEIFLLLSIMKIHGFQC